MIVQPEMQRSASRLPRERLEREGQKMEVLSKLVGGVAHDFNNLLTVILGYTDILLARRPADDADRDLLGEIHKAGERAESLTRQLLAFTRKQVIEPRVLDVNGVISDTEKMLRRVIGEDILMTTIFAPSLYLIKIDPGQMEQLILNLAVHARDAMPRGGRLTIETDNVDIEETYALSNPDAFPGSYVMLAMSDTGAGANGGMGSHYPGTSFTPGPNFDTDPTLAAVYAIVRQNGGFMEYASDVDLGNTYKLFLPEAPSLPASSSHSALRAIPRGSETVLLVEDEDSVRTLARHVLQTCGYTVIEASNGEAALHLVENYGGPIDLLLSDVVMPRLGGRLLAERLLRMRPRLRVLFLSGYTNDAIERHGLMDAEFAFLQKPFTSSVLAQTVRSVLDAAGKK